MAHDDETKRSFCAARAAIEALHETMRERAGAGQWSAFGHLLAERNRLLGDVEAGARRAVYESVLEVNRLLLDQARNDRRATSDRLHALKKQQSLEGYYQSNGG